MPDTNQSLLLQVLAQLGELGQAIGVLQGQATHIIAEQAKHEQSWAAIYERIGALESKASETMRLVPLVDKHEAAYQRGLGAAWLWRAAWGVCAGAAGAAFMLIAKRQGWL